MQSNFARNHFAALDILRGICASAVVVYHFEGDAFIKAIPFFKNAFLFVDFFFVLSGFVIAASYADRLKSGFPLSRFMILRIGRLYPLHLGIILLYLLVAASKRFADPAYNLADLIVSATLTQSWINYPAGEMNHWNAPSWSISAEIWMYLLFGTVCVVAKQKTNLVMAILAVSTVPALYFGSDRYIDVCFSGLGILRCMLGFSLGVLAFSVWRYQRGKKMAVNATAMECIAIACCLALVGVAGAGPWSLLCPPFFALAILVLADESGIISRGLVASPFLRLIGTLSFSIYMVHMFVLARFANLVSFVQRNVDLPFAVDPNNNFAINSTWMLGGSDLACLVSYVLVVLLSWTTYRYIETPFREWSRGLAGRGLRKTVATI